MDSDREIRALDFAIVEAIIGLIKMLRQGFPYRERELHAVHTGINLQVDTRNVAPNYMEANVIAIPRGWGKDGAFSFKLSCHGGVGWTALEGDVHLPFPAPRVRENRLCFTCDRRPPQGEYIFQGVGPEDLALIVEMLAPGGVKEKAPPPKDGPASQIDIDTARTISES